VEEMMQKLVDFATGATFSDLPENAIHEIKRVVLDSIGCAINGLSTDRGKIAVDLARKLGGPPESTIMGTNYKVSSANATFANGELINALDFDAFSEAHSPPIIVPAALALGESVLSSGKNIILSIALGLEVVPRLKSSHVYPISEGPEKGNLRYRAIAGNSAVTLGSAISAGKILGLNQEKMANAIGIAGCICPPNIFAKWIRTIPVRMTKYGPPGWGASTGVISALLAEMGYTGDTDMFDGEYGFWKYTGEEPKSKEILQDLGVNWRSSHISYKQYPCGYCIQGVLDSFIQIIEDNDLRPEDIDSIKAQPDPINQFRLWKENKLRSPDDYHFHIPYLLACAANRINVAHWLDPEIKQKTEVNEFMQRVRVEVIINEKEFGLATLADPKSYLQGVEVLAKGKTFKVKMPHLKGVWYSDKLRNTDEELIKKFSDNASRVITSDRAIRAAQQAFELDKMDKIAPLLEMIAPRENTDMHT